MLERPTSHCQRWGVAYKLEVLSKMSAFPGTAEQKNPLAKCFCVWFDCPHNQSLRMICKWKNTDNQVFARGVKVTWIVGFRNNVQQLLTSMTVGSVFWTERVSFQHCLLCLCPRMPGISGLSDWTLPAWSSGPVGPVVGWSCHLSRA